MTTSHIPQDRYKAVWLIFFMLGLGTLLPWSFFTTATMYFKSRLGASQNDSNALTEQNRDLLGPTSPPLKPNFLDSIFNNAMSVCAMLPLLVFMCLNSFLHQRIPQSLRMSGSLVVILLTFVLTATLVKVHLEPLPFFTLTMIMIVIINSFGAILQSSLFGLAGFLPASYTAPIMSGQGLAGIFASMAMICAIASGSELEESAFGYFITASVVVVITLLCYLALPHLKFYQYYHQMKTEALGEQETKMDFIGRGENSVKVGEEQGTSKPSTQTSCERPSIVAILKEIWVLALSVCFVFTITIGMFPSVTAEVKSTIAGTSVWKSYFVPVACFLTFNTFDWAGRSLTSFCTWPGQDSRWLLPGMVVARVVFVPLMMLCNVRPRNHLPVVFHHDAWFIIFMIFFAFSSGYLASLCMCFGPKKVKPSEAETAGAIMAFFLSLGLALGALLSFLLRAIV